MQRPGEVGLGGEGLLRLEVGEALLEEGAGCVCWLVSGNEEAEGGGGWAYWASLYSFVLRWCWASLRSRTAFQSDVSGGGCSFGGLSRFLLARL